MPEQGDDKEISRTLLKKIRGQDISYGSKNALGKVVSRDSGNDWLNWLSSDQIAKLVCPSSFDDHFAIWLDNCSPGSLSTDDEETFKDWFDGYLKENPWKQLDYSDESVKSITEAVKEALDLSPMFKWAISTYGSPVFGILSKQSSDEYLKREAISKFLDAAKMDKQTDSSSISFRAVASPELEMIGLNPDYVAKANNENFSSFFPSSSDQLMSDSLTSTIIHEWAHWLHAMALRDSELFGSRTESNNNFYGTSDSPTYNAAVTLADEYSEKGSLVDYFNPDGDLTLNPEIPQTATLFGYSNRFESLAEGMVAYMHPNPEVRANSMNTKLKKDVETLLGGVNGTGPWEIYISTESKFGVIEQPKFGGSKIAKTRVISSPVEEKVVEQNEIDSKSAGQLTKPELRERLKNEILAGSEGGEPGRWSSAKAMLLAKKYKEDGGGYRGGLGKTQRNLRKWTRQNFTKKKKKK